MTDAITLQHYAALGKGDESFSGNIPASELAELQKAMFAGDITGRDTESQGATGGSTLKVESLDGTLTWLTSKASDIVLWQKIPKSPAYNTVEEYLQVTDFGEEDNVFNNEAELPEESDSQYQRKSELVKFMGTTRTVSHVMQLVKTHQEIGDVVQHQIELGTMKILRDLNRKLTTGNADIVPQQFNGIYTQQKKAFSTEKQWYGSSNVIDMKGKALTEKAIQDASLNIIENHGEGSLLMGPPSMLTNFVSRFSEFKLIQPNTDQIKNMEAGGRTLKFWSQFGMIDLGYDKFLSKTLVDKKYKSLSSLKTNSKAPDKPVKDVDAAAATDTNTEFGTAHAGNYFYAVSAINRHGESALTLMHANNTTKVVVAATEGVDLDFSDGGGPVAATGYKIYRTEKTETAANAANAKFYPVFEVSTAQLAAGYNGGAAGKVRDLNYYIPNTEVSFMIDPAYDVWRFKQLAPLMKMDLPPLGPATRFMLLLYGTPILAAPKKMIQIINIGSDIT